MDKRKREAKLKRSLRDIFGITQLRPGQAEVIRSVMERRNTLALMPTGAGKSLCYQLPALHIRGTTVIVSPLISLMKDQVDKLKEACLDASQINSTLTEREKDEALAEIQQEQSEFVFVTPERFSDPAFVETLRSTTVDFFVIDEAHCISEWGHDFRPSYLELGAAIKALGCPPILALTATATDRVVQDIIEQLDLPDMTVINTGIYRPNLHYEVVRVTNEAQKQQHLIRLLTEIEGTGIIYAATVKAVEAVTDFLERNAFPVARYHGRLDSRERKENQDRFMAGNLKAMVATNAFGLGIDKRDIRFVIHYTIPGSLEAYYQESGRAGRDGKPARCILLYQLEDRRTQAFFLGGRYPGVEEFAAVLSALQRLEAQKAPVELVQVQNQASHITKTKIRVILSLMEKAGFVERTHGTQIQLRRSDLSRPDSERVAQQYQHRKDYDREKLEHMMRYGQSASCRWALLLEYFAEQVEWEHCGHCDNCLHPVEVQRKPSVAVPQTHFNGSLVNADTNAEVQVEKGEVFETPHYGKGQITAIEGDKIVVSFPHVGVKKFKKDVLAEKAAQTFRMRN